MNMLLISNDTALADVLIRDILHAGDRLHVDPECGIGGQLGAEAQYDVVIASDRLAPLEEWSLPPEPDSRKNVPVRRIMMLSNPHDARRHAAELKLALSEGWEIVPPGCTIRQVAGHIGRLLYGTEDRGPSTQLPGVIHFFGTTPNIGVTTAAYGAAVQMAERTEARIAYVCLNLKSSKIHRYLGAGLNDGQPTIDSLRAELRSGSLTGSRLLQRASADQALPNLFVIQASRQREQADYYTIEEIECLLRAAKEEFDYCVVETGAYWDNAATIGVMRHASQRILVTTPQLSHFQEDAHRWLGALHSLFGLARDDFDLLVTQCAPDSPFHPRHIAKELGMSRIGTIRRCHKLDRQLAGGRLRQAASEPGTIGEDLSRLAGSLCTLHGETRMRSRAAPAAARVSLLPGLAKFVTGGRIALGRR